MQATIKAKKAKKSQKPAVNVCDRLVKKSSGVKAMVSGFDEKSGKFIISLEDGSIDPKHPEMILEFYNVD